MKEKVLFFETISAIIFLWALLHIWIPLSVCWGVLSFFIRLNDGVDYAFIFGLMSFSNIPLWLWDWAKFSHPWWALFISVISISFTVICVFVRNGRAWYE
tara:strand:+ start:176 stop:475 length:300 start_codon:yes stop_codon:yes gene_type:complete